MKRKFQIKEIFKDYFEHNPYIENERIALRPYNPDSDIIYSNFSSVDWNMIFSDIDEDDFKDMGKFYIDRVVLVAIDKKDGYSFGFVCIQESHEVPMEVYFHGGTWGHDIKNILLEYLATDCLLQFLLDNDFSIRATCFITNKKADRFQNSLGFIEYKRDGNLSYKYLNIPAFKSNIVKQRQRYI